MNQSTAAGCTGTTTNTPNQGHLKDCWGQIPSKEEEGALRCLPEHTGTLCQSNMVGTKAIQIMHINQRIRARIVSSEGQTLNEFVEKVSAQKLLSL